MSAAEAFRGDLSDRLQVLQGANLVKHEVVLSSSQGALVTLADGREVINMCANNYLGLAGHPDIVSAARASLDDRGAGMASVRFICGTQDRHRELEEQLARFVACEDAILFSSAFDANGGLFEPLFDQRDVIVSDELNHASVIDGMRLCKARRLRYRNRDMEALEAQLREARNSGARHVVIATDGVFSMDGTFAPLAHIRVLADRHDALVMIDDSHATGFVGRDGRGSHEHADILGQVDLLTGTLGKALGGASGGYVAGSQETVSLLRQQSRPYLFSNSLPPPAVAAGIRALEMVQGMPELRVRLWKNTERFRKSLSDHHLTVMGQDHPIVPVMLGEAEVASQFAALLLEKGIHAAAFSYPVVPKGSARIRTQVTAEHTPSQLDAAADAFLAVADQLRVLP